MNDEPESQASLLDNATAISVPSEDNIAATQLSSNSEARRNLARLRQRQRKTRLVLIKINFLNQLLRSLDVLLYYYYSYAYFLDASFFRFILRCAIQLNFLTPKPANFPHSSQRRSVIYGIFGTAIFCVICHVLNPEPSAAESTGGYLHGGLLIDFVGQEGPVCKLRLIATDLIILALQIFMVAVSLEKHTLKSSPTRPISAPPQDLDNEERGELAEEVVAANMNSVENSDGHSESDGEPEDSRDADLEMLSEDVRPERQPRQGTQHDGENPSPLLPNNDSDDDDGRYNAYSGQLVIVNVRFIDAIRLQWNHGGLTSSRTTTEASPLRRRSTAREALRIIAQINARRETGGF